MYTLNRRRFLKFLGQGTAALGAGMGFSGGLLNLTGCTKAKKAETGNGYQVFFPGKYSDTEKEALDRFKASLPLDLLGDPYEVTEKEVRPEIISSHNAIVSPRNPLYNDEAYAQKTRFGAMVAAPFYGEQMNYSADMYLPEFGNEWLYARDGGEAEFFEPVSPGDVLTSKIDFQTIEDITPEEGSTLRVFKVTGKGSIYNQDNKLVFTETIYARNGYRRNLEETSGSIKTIHHIPVPGKKFNTTTGDWVERHHYTDEDWDEIVKAYDAQYIRGKETLYWEDAKEGESLTPVVTAPLTIIEQVAHASLWFVDLPKKRDLFKSKEHLLKMRGITYDKNGAAYLLEEHHFDACSLEGTLGEPFDTFLRNLEVEMVTGFMGDDGWLSKIKWYNYDRHLGDPGDPAREILDVVPALKGKKADLIATLFNNYKAKGYVLKKYTDGDDHKMDIACWIEDCHGKIGTPALATLILPVRS